MVKLKEKALSGVGTRRCPCACFPLSFFVEAASDARVTNRKAVVGFRSAELSLYAPIWVKRILFDMRSL